VTTRPKKSAGRASSALSPLGIGIVTVAALIGFGALVVMGGGFAAPTDAPPTAVPLDQVSDEVAMAGGPLEVTDLVDCGGAPCPAIGPEDAPVTFIEVSEYTCPHCRDHNQDVAPQLVEEFVDTGQMRLVSHIFAMTPTTMYVAAASLCAEEQGKYFEFQHEAFKDDLGLSGAEVASASEDVATRLGLDVAAFKECAEESRYMEQVQLSSLDVQRAEVLYTPTFIVNGLIIEGGQPVELLRTKIEQAIEEG
jgi:hypothetical protein